MAKNNLPKRYYLIPLGLIIIASILLVVFQSFPGKTITTEQTPEIFRELPSWKNDAVWSTPSDSSENTYLGNIKGQQTQAPLEVSEPNVAHFENIEYLLNHGFQPDNNLSADGPGSSSWGYKKTEAEKTEVLIFSYQITPTSSSPNSPLEFNCPCKGNLKVFYGSIEQSEAKLANPASENCTEKGGSLSIETRGDGGQYGLCNFEDDMSCEEWALYRGECPVGGVKTTGYDSVDQMYCVWLGGQTLAVANSTCTLPNGNVCSTIDLYNGKCF